MSYDYGITSFTPYLNEALYSAPTSSSTQDDSSIFGAYENNVGGFAVNYSSAYDSIINDFNANIEAIRAAQAAEENAELQNGQNVGQNNEYLSGNGDSVLAGTEGTNLTGTEGTEAAEGTEGAESAEGTEGAEAAEGTEGTESTEGTEGTEPTGDANNAMYTDEERILVNETVQDILDATVRVKTGPFSLGTDEEALINILSNDSISPKVMRGVQAVLQEQGYDLFELIRSETSWGTEDILEGYALAKLGGTSKESGTQLESYERYQNMDKSSADYQIYIRNCVSLFKQSVDGWGTDEKVLAYVMSLPDDIRADVEALYNEKYGSTKSFMDRGKDEVSGILYDHYWN